MLQKHKTHPQHSVSPRLALREAQHVRDYIASAASFARARVLALPSPRVHACSSPRVHALSRPRVYATSHRERFQARILFLCIVFCVSVFLAAASNCPQNRPNNTNAYFERESSVRTRSREFFATLISCNIPSPTQQQPACEKGRCLCRLAGTSNVNCHIPRALTLHTTKTYQ